VYQPEPEVEATCERVRSLTIAGREVAIVRTPRRGWELYWVAIRTEVGWFVSGLPIEVRVSGGNGTGTTWQEGSAGEPVVRGAALAGQPTVIVDVATTLTAGCTVCVPYHGAQTTRDVATMVCQVGPVGVGCAGPLWSGGTASRVRARGGVLVVEGVGGDQALRRGTYTLAPSAPVVAAPPEGSAGP
jgi:hypothetical protein